MTYIVLREHQTPRAPATCAGRIILCHLPDNEATPFVTWWENTDLGGRCWGHYFADRNAAERDFDERVSREIRRAA